MTTSNYGFAVPLRAFKGSVLNDVVAIEFLRVNSEVQRRNL